MLIAIGILEKVSLVLAPPIYDPLGYIKKAKNVWASIQNGYFSNLLNIEPISRPPGSSLILYPFGFIDNFKNYLFRSTFIPILLWTAALYFLYLF